MPNYKQLRPTRVYVAGPYTKPDPVANTNKAIAAGNALMEVGFVPFIPHLTMTWHLVTPKAYYDWIAYDDEWLKVCDVLVRLPGHSEGADHEVSLARQLGIPVLHGVEDCIKCVGRFQEVKNGHS